MRRVAHKWVPDAVKNSSRPASDGPTCGDAYRRNRSTARCWYRTSDPLRVKHYRRLRVSSSMCVIVLALFALHGQRSFHNSKDHAHERRNSVENCREFYRRRETLRKGFDSKSATPIRKTDLDGFYALSASANKIDAVKGKSFANKLMPLLWQRNGTKTQPRKIRSNYRLDNSSRARLFVCACRHGLIREEPRRGS